MRSPLKVTINGKEYDVPIPGIARAFGFRSMLGAYRREDYAIAVVGVLALCWRGDAPWGEIPTVGGESIVDHGARVLEASYAAGVNLAEIDAAAWAFAGQLSAVIAPPSQGAADEAKKSSSPTEAQTSAASEQPASGAAMDSAGSGPPAP
jgi:hypothetical protein